MLLLFPLLMAGCKSRLGPCVSPRVTGRVLAANTGRPLEGVLVTRGPTTERRIAGWSPKGGELLTRPAPARTDSEGRFMLQSERVLTLVPTPGWNSVRLTLDCAGYQRLQTNLSFTAFGLTNGPGTPDALEAGDIRLSPLHK